MNQHLKNIYYLGIKEIIELARDKCMMILILYAFSLGIYISAIGSPEPVCRAPICVVDEDNTQLSKRITDALLPPLFQPPQMVAMKDVDPGLDGSLYTFALVIPADFQKDVLSGKMPELQLSADATQMTQAFVGAGYIQQIVDKEIEHFELGRAELPTPARLDLRNRFNENLDPCWFGGLNQTVNTVTMLAIVLIGAALIRERERGTLEHLLVMPVETYEIMCAKLWSMLLVVLGATMFTVTVILQRLLDMPTDGSMLLFMVGVALHLFAVISMGIFLSCIAQNMAQLGILIILVLLPMNMLSGGITPRECMPGLVQDIMMAAPTTHFVTFCQQILFRGAGIETAWKPFSWLAVIGTVLFFLSLGKFKRSATSS